MVKSARYNSLSFCYRGVLCNVMDCGKVSFPQMGHDTCAFHCRCLITVDDSYVYDPSLCDVCIRFCQGNFAGITDAGIIKVAAGELDGHVEKLRRYLARLEQKFSLKLSPFARMLRAKCRSKKFDEGYFQGLRIPESMADEDTASVRF